MTVGLKL